jgi:hypothetical protein
MGASRTLCVMPGLDPVVHEAERCHKPFWSSLSKVIMDCQVKPGNDRGKVVAGMQCCVSAGVRTCPRHAKYTGNQRSEHIVAP